MSYNRYNGLDSDNNLIGWDAALVLLSSSFSGTEQTIALTSPVETIHAKGFDFSFSYDAIPYVTAKTIGGTTTYYCAVGHRAEKEITQNASVYDGYVSLIIWNGESNLANTEEVDGGGIEVSHSGTISNYFSFQRYAFSRKNQGELITVAKRPYPSMFSKVVSYPGGLYSTLWGRVLSAGDNLETFLPINIAGNTKVLFSFSMNNYPWISRVSLSAGHAELSTTQNGARLFYDSTAYLWGKDIYLIFVGTGIIFSQDGYILTNCHVIAGCSRCKVWVTDEYGVDAEYEARVVGYDEDADLAVLKVNATGLTAAEFGNSEQTQVGERVCVIGNPGGLRFQNSLTVGYVSALNRAVYIGNYTINCIQTDAAINPGNSGGPLINAYGQVIGISSAKIALEEYEGICFAIPISEAMPILQQLISEGKVTGRAMLGITATPVKATEAEFYEIPLGLWVKGVTPGSDIARKGVREGDIITHLAGQPIYTLDACSNVLRDYAPGDTIQVTVFRREGSVTDNTFTVDVILEAS